MTRYLFLLTLLKSMTSHLGFHTVNCFVLPKSTTIHSGKASHSYIKASTSFFHQFNAVRNQSSIILSMNAADGLPMDAFTDEIVFFDDSIKVLLFSFTAFVVLALVAKFFLNQMDSAIEKVLNEFESTMKTKYASRWVSMEAKLKGLKEPERSQRLFEIMEELQKLEPEFYAKVMGDSGWSME